MNENFNNLSENLLCQSKEAISNLGRCLEAFQCQYTKTKEEEECLIKYENFLSNLTSLQVRSEHLKQRLLDGGTNKNYFAQDLSKLLNEFQSISNQLSQISVLSENQNKKPSIDQNYNTSSDSEDSQSDDNNINEKEKNKKVGTETKGPSNESSPASILSFKPKPLKLKERQDELCVNANDITVTKRTINTNSITNANTLNNKNVAGSIRQASLNSPTKKRHSRRRNSNDEVTLPSFFNRRNRISLALVTDEDDYNTDDETIILNNHPDDTDIPFEPLRKYNSHESLLSVKHVPLKRVSGFLLPQKNLKSTTAQTVTSRNIYGGGITTTRDKQFSSTKQYLSELVQERKVPQHSTAKLGFWGQLKKYAAPSIPTAPSTPIVISNNVITKQSHVNFDVLEDALNSTLF
ncbi:uncharacterized protein SCODWIG_00645 [Saccharomycodes ludwigii]|uniref:Uncharacterized protein n=1 Tax=Saccharomycodes ludwigii TaxID=36035 RepID=A0A376B339_9ASCO|nr:hypothetical protein SCDLUD_003807 [Saccharomycodes ludwigii]KAH3899530.1 hypothetical protein SCDLUD_003807 [Saccharomycodes ludwigii]SSD58884.1 uncharacterized protein SCODWIG_00645 [Saccharomycodes ludwigii]